MPILKFIPIRFIPNRQSIFSVAALVLLFSLLMLPAITSAQENNQDEDDDEEVDYYEQKRFKSASGIAGMIGITSTGFQMSVNYIKLFSPDLIGTLTLSLTNSKDPNEVERFENQFVSTRTIIFDNETGLRKLNSMLLFPVSLSLQQRLFRGNINPAFRPFVEVGAGPTFGYRYSYVDGLFRNVAMQFGGNAFIGAGAYFGSNPMNLQGLTIRYQVNAFPQGIELLPGRFRQVFDGISLNLVFGTFF
jgi:hypothetical protein